MTTDITILKSVLLLICISPLDQCAGNPEPKQTSNEPAGTSQAKAKDEPAKTARPGDTDRSALLKEARQIVGEIKVYKLAGRKRDAVELIEQPLLTYVDVPRENEHGTVWAWGRTGRPIAMVELYRNTRDRSNRGWVHAATSTSTGLFTADIADGVEWSPRTAGVELKRLEQAPAVAAEEPVRLRQMKELARRFAAHEFWDPDNQRYELRLLAQPLHRYREPQAGLLDGVVFIFAHGTNPEIVLLIEAAGKDTEAATWQYGFVRLGSAEMHVSLDGGEVWTQPRTPGVIGAPTDPYWMFFKPALRPLTEEPENRQ